MWKVPHTVEPLLKQAGKQNQVNHAGLLFFRYLDGKGEPDQRRERAAQLKEVERAQFTLLKPYRERMLRFYSYLPQSGYAVSCRQATLLTRMAVGLGIPSVFENGLCLHHVHGFPYIPGSALKGVAQDWALQELGVTYKELPKYLDKKKRFVPVFGGQFSEAGKPGIKTDSYRGHILFLDALPLAETNLLAVDVMTPHYEDYYRTAGGERPGDWCNPNPIPFLTVREGTPFLFCLAARDVHTADGTIVRAKADVLDDATCWLEGALQVLGVGGKTSVGYGHFAEFQDHPLT